MELEGPDAHGYPTEKDVAQIRAWSPSHTNPPPFREVHEALLQIRELWTYPDYWTVSEAVDEERQNLPVWKHAISTGGWSGNEDIVEALQSNIMLWGAWFYSHKRGGHYVLLVPK
jgi:hypothetical protein